MIKVLNEKYIKWLILSTVIVSLIALIVVHNVGKKQDQEIISYLSEYQYAIDLMYGENTEFDIDKANTILANLIEKYPDSHMVYWRYGISFALLGELDEAIDNFNKAQELRPFIIMEPAFTLQFAEIYYFIGENQKAKAYLDHGLELQLTDDQREYAELLLTQINDES